MCIITLNNIGNNGLFVVYNICFGEGLFGTCFEREIDLFDFVYKLNQVLQIMVEE